MKLILNLVEMNEIDFEFIFYHSSLIWLNLNAIYFMVTYSDFFFFLRNYSDFVIFNFYEHYASVWIEMKIILLFSLFLLLFMGHTTLFGTIHGSYCTILINFYLYLQYFR